MFVASLLPLLAIVLGGSAPVITDSPEDTYVAEFDKTLSGSVKFSGLSNGSVEVSVDIEGFPSAGGPFSYHVHAAPVPSSGNCSGTLGHLDPYVGIENNFTDPADSQVGDLSGRHGKLTGSADISYVDEYISLNSTDPAYIGGLSVTFHYANSSRIACANITQVEEKTPSISNSTYENAANAGYANLGMGAVAIGLALVI